MDICIVMHHQREQIVTSIWFMIPLENEFSMQTSVSLISNNHLVVGNNTLFL
jgi:hypothetical protein